MYLGGGRGGMGWDGEDGRSVDVLFRRHDFALSLSPLLSVCQFLHGLGSMKRLRFNAISIVKQCACLRIRSCGQPRLPKRLYLKVHA